MMENKNKIMIVLVAIILVSISLLFVNDVNKRKTEVHSISDYQFKDITKNKDFFEGSELEYFLKSTTGKKIETGSLNNDLTVFFGISGGEVVVAEKVNVSDLLPSIMYFPTDNILSVFGQDKPINIIFGAPASESEDPYDSPLYIGYYDGTCEYPEEFDYVRSKKKCSQYLQDTLDFVGFDTVDEMLEYSFGDYLIKEDSEESEIE